MKNDPEGAREDQNKNMEKIREHFNRDRDHFSPNTAADVVKLVEPFVYVHLKWNKCIIQLVMEFLVDPNKQDAQEQPF